MSLIFSFLTRHLYIHILFWTTVSTGECREDEPPSISDKANNRCFNYINTFYLKYQCPTQVFGSFGLAKFLGRLRLFFSIHIYLTYSPFFSNLLYMLKSFKCSVVFVLFLCESIEVSRLLPAVWNQGNYGDPIIQLFVRLKDKGRGRRLGM